jgi:hypothetical protein
MLTLQAVDLEEANGIIFQLGCDLFFNKERLFEFFAPKYQYWTTSSLISLYFVLSVG